jgi:hypothetical protein
LFFTFIIVFSPFAAEEISTSVVTVKASTSRMDQVIGILEENGVKLSETVFCSDFDETLATTVGFHKDHEFKLLTCPDRKRTYKKAFSAAFEKFEYNLDFFDITNMSDTSDNNLRIKEAYEILDFDAIDLISKLKKEAFFVGVCSSLSGDEDKYTFMENKIGLERDKFIFGGGSKSQAICGYLEKLKKPDIKISTIVLLDNSEEFAINPFLEKMPGLVGTLGFNNLKIIGIEFTKFSAMATQEAIAEELTLLDTLCKGK